MDIVKYLSRSAFAAEKRFHLLKGLKSRVRSDSPAAWTGLEPLEDRLLLSSYTFQDLASFSGANGNTPYGNLIMDSSGNLYGTTTQGGASSDGAIFEWVKSSGTISVLASFNGANGLAPEAGLIMDGSGNLFGTTASGGANNDGVVFKWVKSSGTISVLASFNGTNGQDPSDLIMDGSGNLFGACGGGGSGALGTLFEWVKSSGTISVLANFTGAGASGYAPYYGKLVMDASGNLYGTTNMGGANSDGAIFEWVKSGGTLTPLAAFSGANGHYPLNNMVMDAAGNLYGTTQTGGTANQGVVFELANGSGTITALASFTGAANGASPESGLFMDIFGNLYGTTNGGGANSGGTVFELAKGSGTITTLEAFNSTNGYGTYGNLTMDAHGNLYGVTSSYFNNGAVFELSPTTITLTSPLASSSVNVGGNYTITWWGGDSLTTVQLWAYGPNGWTDIKDNAASTTGSYSWSTTGFPHGWYYFQAQVDDNGTWYNAGCSPNWLHVVNPTNHAPTITLTSPPAGNASVTQGDSFNITWTASDLDSDTLHVSLWAWNGDTNGGQWFQVPGASWLTNTGSYSWNTTGYYHGWYEFAAYVWDGDAEGTSASPGWLHIVEPPAQAPTFTFLTPTSGQTVTYGNSFSLNWSATVASQDVGKVKVQLWACYFDYINGDVLVWTEIAVNLNPATGIFSWNTSTINPLYRWYSFSAWIGYGDVWVNATTPNWLQVV